MIVTIIILMLLLALFFIPIKLEIKLSSMKISSNKKDKNNRIIVKIFYFIPVYVYNLKKLNKYDEDKDVVELILDIFVSVVEKQKIKKVKGEKKKPKVVTSEDISKILKNIKVGKFILSLGVNTGDYITNSYVNAVINTALCLFININSKKFNFNKLYYKVYTSKKLYEYDISCIFMIRAANTIAILIKIIYRKLKERWNFKWQNNIQLKT